MTVMTPAQVAEELGIQTSTLRKYSLLLEAEGIEFERTAKNARLYTVTDVMTLRNMIELIRSGVMTVENAAKTVSGEGEEEEAVMAETVRNDVPVTPQERSVDVAEELKSLRETIEKLTASMDRQREAMEKRDQFFIRAMVEMQGEIESLRAALPEPAAEDPAEEIAAEQEENVADKTVPDSDDVSSTDAITKPKPKKGFFARLFGR